jgi:hypothetical protein
MFEKLIPIKSGLYPELMETLTTYEVYYLAIYFQRPKKRHLKMPLIIITKGYSDFKIYQNVLELTFNKISVFKSKDFIFSENFNTNTFCIYCQAKYIWKK